jgi:hypothetical protein
MTGRTVIAPPLQFTSRAEYQRTRIEPVVIRAHDYPLLHEPRVDGIHESVWIPAMCRSYFGYVVLHPLRQVLRRAEGARVPVSAERSVAVVDVPQSTLAFAEQAGHRSDHLLRARCI